MIPTRISIALAVLAMLSVLAGCAEGPAGNGAAARAILASQTIAPRPHADSGSDAAAATAAYANYKQSYAQPTPQSDSGLVRK